MRRIQKIIILICSHLYFYSCPSVCKCAKPSVWKAATRPLQNTKHLNQKQHENEELTWSWVAKWLQRKHRG